MPRLTEALISDLEALRREGVSIEDACTELNLSTKTFYRWKAAAEAGENGLVKEFHDRVIPYRRQGKLEATSEVEGWRSIEAFKEWSSHLILDTGEPWEPERWQLEAVEDMLDNENQAVWLVVPEGNGKTTLVAAVVLYLLEHQITPEIPIGSATTTQAETLFRQIEGFIVRSGKLKDYNLAPGVRRIDCRRTMGHTRVYPHNQRSGDGVIPSAAVLDEGHLHPDLRLYRTWKGKYRKRKGTVIVISTAGEPDSEFEGLRTKLLKEGESAADGPHVRAVNQSTVLHDWAIRRREDAEDMEAMAAANPLSTITADWLREKRAEPEMTDEHWLRFTGNWPTRVEGQAILPEVWDSLVDTSISPSSAAWKIAFLDVAWEIDCTAMGILSWESQELRIVAGIRIFEPPVDEADVVQAMVHLQQEFDPGCWVFDPNTGGRQMAQQLDKGEHRLQGDTQFEFVEHSQNNEPMALAAQRLDDAIRNRWLRHDGHPGLRHHVLSAVRRSTNGDKWRYDRPPDAKGRRRAKFPTDALTGLLMGNSVAVAEHENESRAVYFL